MAVFRRRGVQCLVGVGVLAAAAVMVPGLAQAAGEVPRYVAVAGSDTVGGDCTLAAQPCATVQHALAVAGTGDIVLVAAGTYHEALASTYGTALAVSVQGGWDAGWQGQSGVTTMDATGRTSPAGTGEVLRLRNAADDVSLDHVTLTGGQGLGGAITVQGGTLHLTRSVLTGNRASSGGAINSSGTVTVTDSTLSNNTAADAAGGIDNSGTLTLASSTVADNAVDPTRFDGGALRNTGIATITGSTLRGNSAREGGGIRNGGTLTVTDSLITGNAASSTGGGVMAVGGGVTITRTGIVGNTAATQGGGYYAYGGVSPGHALIDSTISGNTADQGGGVWTQGGSVLLSSSSVTANHATTGGGVYSVGAVQARNTIVAANAATGSGADCAGGGITSLGYDLISSLTGCGFSPSTGDLVNVDAALGPVTNGAQAIEPGSPAVDAGNPATPGTSADACPTVDQSGQARSGRCDIGAVESLMAPTGPQPTTSGAPSPSSGQHSAQPAASSDAGPMRTQTGFPSSSPPSSPVGAQPTASSGAGATGTQTGFPSPSPSSSQVAAQPTSSSGAGATGTQTGFPSPPPSGAQTAVPATSLRSSAGGSPTGTGGMSPPAAPTGVAVTVGDHSATITWLKPDQDGGSPITGYTVTATPGGQSCSTADPDVLTCTVSGLQNGVDYTFTVTARNAAGAGQPGTTPPDLPALVGTPPGPVTVLPPEYTPPAPGTGGGGTGSGDGTSVTVRWLAAHSDPQLPVIGYTATATANGYPSGTCSTTGELTCTITGLTAGVDYAIRVVAVNGIGTSATTAPGAPTGVTVGAGAYRQAVVRWTAPEATGGSPIIGYTATASTGQSCSTAALSCTLVGLGVGDTFTVSVTTRNATGLSAPSEPSAPFTVAADVMAPTVVGHADRAPDATVDGVAWWTGPVSVTWTATDDESGIDAPPPPTAVTAQGATTATSAQACDRVGNCATGTLTVRIDGVGPVVTIGGVVDGAAYVLGHVPASTCTATDAQTGLAGACTLMVTGGNANQVGPITATATARDRAGNATTVKAHYAVHYPWSGFDKPGDDPEEDPGSVVSVFKAGSTVPVKFVLAGASGQALQPVTAPVWVTPVRGAATSLPVGESVYTDQPDTGVSYQQSGGHWQYNWKTDKAMAGFYWRLGVRLDDGTTHYVTVGLR